MTGVSLQEIEAWQRLNGVRFTPWELETIIEVDAAFMSVASEKKG